MAGASTAVDLNADLAEGETLTASDLAVLDTVTSASLACGFHAGNRAVMQATAAACLARGVVIGAHVSFRDREGFGRRPLDTDPAEVAADIVEQVSILAEAILREGASLSYVKPHGALYHRMGTDAAMAVAVVDGVTRAGLPAVVAQPASAVVRPAAAAGLALVQEGFPDRGYRSDGRLVPRGRPRRAGGGPRGGRASRASASLAGAGSSRSTARGPVSKWRRCASTVTPRGQRPEPAPFVPRSSRPA